MRKPLALRASSLLWLVLVSSPLTAGTYLGTTACDPTTFCQVGRTQAAPQQNITPFGIVHPIGFDQAGGSIQVRICVDSIPATGLEAATQWAVDLWNDLQARTESCFRCRDFEEGEPSPPSVPYELTSLLVHELGHCALALDHGNRL